MMTLLLYLRLFWEFFKTGLFAIGGGMATVPFLSDMGRNTGWFTSAELADMIAVSESTPGPIGVNMATYVGYVVGHGAGGELNPGAEVFCGVLGAVVATIGLITPSIIIVLIVAAILKRFRGNRWVEAGLYGLRAGSVALISAAALSVILISMFSVEHIASFQQAVFDWRALVLAIVLLIATRWIPKVKKWHPVIFIAISAVVGIVFHLSGTTG